MKTAWLTVVAFVMSPLAGWSAEKAETRFSMDQLPAAVKATIEKETAGAKIEEIEKESEGGKSFYEAEFEKNGHMSYIHVAEDGKVLKRETAAQERKGKGREKEEHHEGRAK